MENKTVLVLGASTNPDRFAFKAINKLLDFGHHVIGVGNRPGVVRSVEFVQPEHVTGKIHTITLYLRPANQKTYYDFILALKPERIIFNPGTENDELISLAQKQGIQCVRNCTLVMLDAGIF
jgi:predicted CoA-binding protein